MAWDRLVAVHPTGAFVNRAAYWDLCKPSSPHGAPPGPLPVGWTPYEGHGPGVELLGEPRTALELGAGEGREAAWLARSGVRVTGVDVSAVQVARARRWWADVRGLDFVCADVETYLAGTGRVWDVVYSIWGAAWFCDPESLFPLVRRRFVPGGRFVFSHGETAPERSGPEFLRPRADVPGVPRWCYPPQEWAARLKAAGFVSAEVSVVPGTEGGRATVVGVGRTGP
ncbi:class I SAM-dependent methyltransferase [Streptomyces sp. SID11385]|uniref:class I SAM-dependent methyltransferase n=1 Tax=Streptomyces sp. SID11385 TaxID=2706031 RepID=UPI0013CAAD8E|nr:class I SAM-dependent methyltransferase [Streptomyces sp. SID11385]NEA39121.1 class I SAM-dependent methyltransferase [Streptomyces sp. SID11385]